MQKKFIPVNSPLITREDAMKVYKVVKSGWISSAGKEIENFEKKFSAFVGRKYACAVSSGTAALEIAVKSLDLKKKSPEKINKIAIEASADLIKQVIGADVNNSNISAIVEDISKRNQEKYYGN